MAVGRQDFYQIDANTRRRAQPCSWWNFRCKKKVHRNITSDLFKNRERNFQGVAANVHPCDVLPCLYSPEVRRDDLNFSVAPLLQHRIEMLVNGRAQNSPPKSLII